MSNPLKGRMYASGVLTKEFEVEPLKGSGWRMTIAHIPKPAFAKMQEKNMTRVYDKELRGHVQRLDVEGTYHDYGQFIVLGWTGLKLKWLQKLVAFDMTGQDPEAAVEYDRETLTDMLRASEDLAVWVANVAIDPVRFETGAVVTEQAEKKI